MCECGCLVSIRVFHGGLFVRTDWYSSYLSGALFGPWKPEAKFARNDKGHKNLHCVPLDLTLKSAADFMEAYKHLEGCRETGTQTLALLLLGKVYEKKKKTAQGKFL